MSRPQERDLGWGAMYEVSERMAATYGVPVKAARRHTIRGVTEGIAIPSFGVFEPVRQRKWFRWEWRELQRVQDGAARIGALLRSRSGSDSN